MLTIQNIGTLVTPTPHGIETMRDTEILVDHGMIVSIGVGVPQSATDGSIPAVPYPPAPISKDVASGTVIDAQAALVTPGLIDPHTHVIYGGHRASEVALKLAGTPYLDILAGGGGILSTVRATRAATDEDLFESARVRLESMLRMGTTTAEVKTGYGLSLEEELRLLRIIAELDTKLPMTLIPTFMGAHAVPPEFRNRTDDFVTEVVERMIPAVAKQGIARFCDVFCETGVFTIEQSRRILKAGRAHGLAAKIHADEIDPPGDGISGAGLAAEVDAVSADHLRATDARGMAAMAEGGVTPVVLPATSFCLRDHRYAHARQMIDEFSLPVALATDCNPGTSPTESLQFVMATAALELRMTPEEILAGVTTNAARAITLPEACGMIQPGAPADMVIWQAKELSQLSYRFGGNQVAMVIKAGVVVA